MSRPPVVPLLVPLLVVGALVCGAGLGVELARHLGSLDPDGRLRAALSLSYEANLPTWYSAGLLWTAALGLGVCAAREPGRDRAWWWGLAVVFALMSLDEAIELHEALGGAELGGVLYFSWVVPGAALVAAFGLAYVRFWWRLSPPARSRFAWAGAVYVGGALGMELPLGAWFEAHGDENLGYALLDWGEETLEIVGVSVFVHAIVGHYQGALSISGAGTAATTSGEQT